MKNFLIEHVICKEAFDWSAHHHAFINPYNGCTAGCPYCFWLSKENWENRIQIRENIAEVLDASLEKWASKEFVYMGSVCDPFMEIEREHRLSKACLEVIKRHETPLLITTSAMTDIVREYVDLFKSMKQRVIIVTELSRISLLGEFKAGRVHTGIENANYLKAQGLEIWATVSPVLPGVSDLREILDCLDPEIPVYVDSLQCQKDSIQARKIMAWIRSEYPQFEEVYRVIVNDQDTSYFTRLLEEFRTEKRVKTFPFKFE